MSEKTVIILASLVTLVILVFGVVFLTKTSQTAQVNASQNAKLETESKNFDWGQIPYSGGNAVKTFTIKNTGTDALKLINVKTSCTCTQAKVTINGSESPAFSMHNTSSWVGEVPPGGQAQLTVIFDPAFHGPSGVGPITRLVSLETNDSTNPKLEFTLTGTVVK